MKQREGDTCREPWESPTRCHALLRPSSGPKGPA
jgi:hypothetical protein